MESGKITECRRQIPYELQPAFIHDGKRVLAITYVADFVLRYADGSEEVIDIKGCPDATAIIKRKMFWHRYPDIKYEWITYSKIDGGFVPYEYVKAERKKRRNRRKENE